MMCEVLALNTASAGTFGKGCSTSSSSGSSRRGVCASSRHRRTLGRFSATSLGCHERCASAGAKYAACWPVPEPISSTWRRSANTRFRTARIGARLRSQASENCFIAELHDTAVVSLRVGEPQIVTRPGAIEKRDTGAEEHRHDGDDVFGDEMLGTEGGGELAAAAQPGAAQAAC